MRESGLPTRMFVVGDNLSYMKGEWLGVVERHRYRHAPQTGQLGLGEEPAEERGTGGGNLCVPPCVSVGCVSYR